MRSFWFPLSLGVVLLVGLTGCVLLAMHLFGQGFTLGPLTSSWLLPLWAGFVFLTLPILLLLLYFLKLKRKSLAVPSTFLWRKTIEDTHVNSFIEWIKRNLLLLLQLLTLFLFLFALLAFQYQGEATRGKFHVLLVDNSASMSATDVEPTRLEQARQEALEHVDALREGDAAMIVAFNQRSSVLQPFTTDKALLRKALRGIEQTQALTRIDDALEKAEGRANPIGSTDDQAVRPVDEDPSKARTWVPTEGVPTEVHLFSDGGFPDSPEFALGNLTLRYHRVGLNEPANNVGIIAFNTERDDKDANLLKVLVRVRNYRHRAARVRVQLEVRVGDTPRDLHEVKLSLPAQSESEPEREIASFRLFDVRQRSNVVLNAKLLDANDVFPVDNEAWLTVGITRKARVLLVSPSENRPLESFLKQSVEEGLVVYDQLDSKELEKDSYRKGAREGEWDLVLFDRCEPTREVDLPQCNAFFIDALPPPWQREKMPKVKGPLIKRWATDHPLMRGLEGLDGIPIVEGFQFDLRAEGVQGRPPRLLETDRENALLFTLPRRPYLDLILTCGLLDRAGRWNFDWPLHLSFPLFMKNVVVDLGNVEGSETMQPGNVKRLRPEGKAERIEVIHPSGKSYTLNRGGRADLVFDRVDRVGVYEVRQGNTIQRRFTANLLDARESDLRPRQELQIGAERVVAGETGRQTRDLWKVLAVLAFLLLLAEWMIYHRRLVL